MKENGEIYECYSKKIYGFLTMKGFRYKNIFKHNTTGKRCWTYEMTEELSQALYEWSKGKKDGDND